MSSTTSQDKPELTKGRGVEGDIGWFRRNHLVPVPRVSSVDEPNAMIDGFDDADDARRIGARARTVGEHGRVVGRGQVDRVRGTALSNDVQHVRRRSRHRHWGRICTARGAQVTDIGEFRSRGHIALRADFSGGPVVAMM